MSAQALRFIRKNGKIIPIRALTGAATVGTHHALKKTPNGQPPLKPQGLAKFSSTLLAVSGGIAAGASFGHGGRAVLGAHAVNEGLDAASTALSFGAFAGKGRAKERWKKGAELEMKNQALGWSAYALTAARNPAFRKKAAGYAAKIIAFGKKALKGAME